MTNYDTPLESQRFRANKIPAFSVIRVCIRLGDDSLPKYKLLVVLTHRAGHAICIKATSQTFKYENDKQQMAGCVFYRAKELPCFPANTAIQPDNQIPVPHTLLDSEYRRGELEVWQLPADFLSRLREAIQNSIDLNGRERKRILEMLG